MTDSLADTLDLGLRAGELLLRNGAETWRIEDTVSRIVRGLGAAESDVVATPTAIFATVSGGGETRTRVRRVRGAKLNLAMVDAVNDFSRHAAAGQLSLAEARAALARIEHAPPHYRQRATALAALLSAIGFVFLFGGGLREVWATVPGAAVLAALDLSLERAEIPSLAAKGLAALVGTAVAGWTMQLLPTPLPDVVLLSTVVLLVPGGSIVTAIGDLMGGHLISGLARGAAAALLAAAIAAGVVAGLWLSGMTV